MDLTSTKDRERRPFLSNVKIDLTKNYELYLLIVPALIYFLLFQYYPMYGVQIAFRDFIPTKGFWKSEWVGFEHFQRFFRSYHFWILIKNTLGISVFQLIVGFPMPIVLALMLNEVRHKGLKKFVQTVTYAPHFISVVVLVGMLITVLAPRNGLANQFVRLFGGKSINFMAKPAWFKPLYVLSGVWQHTGWSAIIYLAALSGISPTLYEAAKMDGATKLQKIWHIDIPGILPTAIILLILNCGRIMSVGFQKVFLMQNDLNMISSNVISTYVYRSGLLRAEFSFATAVGLFNAIINFILLLCVNAVAKRASETSLW